LSAQIAFVPNAVALLNQRWGKPVLVKETGLPSGPPGSVFTPANQSLFWRGLWSSLRPSAQKAVACFEAFDAPWKPAELESQFGGDRPEEAFWGFYDVNGRPKPVVEALRRQRP
jgi:exo-beta-1,3-glucanase (GH17 family)